MAVVAEITYGIEVVLSDKTTLEFAGVSVILTGFESGATGSGIY